MTGKANLMDAQLLEGKKVAQKLKAEIQDKIQKLGASPVLRAIQVGTDPASELYLKSQVRAAESVGAKHEVT